MPCYIVHYSVFASKLELVLHSCRFSIVIVGTLSYSSNSLSALMFRQQGKRLASLEMELAAAKHEGFVGKYTSETNATHSKKKPLVVIGIMTSFGRKNYREAVRKSWLPTGTTS